MKNNFYLAVVGFLFLGVAIVPTAIAAGYLNPLAPGLIGDATIQWKIKHAPAVPFELFFSGSGKWIASNDSILSFQITELGDEVGGIVTLGNSTWRGNDTDVALDLTLGVWGLTQWSPGFLIDTDEDSLISENASAYTSAERVFGNYLNGTMVSNRGIIQANGIGYNCISFDYVQDQPIFGTPLLLQLSYDLSSGVLVYANVSYSFGTPYNLEIEILSVSTPLISSFLLFVGAILFLIALVAIVDQRS